MKSLFISYHGIFHNRRPPPPPNPIKHKVVVHLAFSPDLEATELSVFVTSETGVKVELFTQNLKKVRNSFGQIALRRLTRRHDVYLYIWP